MGDVELETLATQVGHALESHGRRLVTAESCTGGWVAAAVTSVAGSSAWFDRGFVTYSNEAKQELLGVQADTLAAHGAVSEPVVREMARGALTQCPAAGVSVAVSGIAGPEGGSEHKPVGTVCLAWATSEGRAWSTTMHYEGDREGIRRQAVADVLRGLVDLVPG